MIEFLEAFGRAMDKASWGPPGVEVDDPDAMTLEQRIQQPLYKKMDNVIR